MMTKSNFSRRDFLRLAGLAGAAAAFPTVLSGRAFAAYNAPWPVNDHMIARLAAAQVADPATFIFVGDVHVPFDDKGIFSTIARRANELGVSFVHIGGDNVQIANLTNYRQFLTKQKKFSMPVISTIGNHDTACETGCEDWSVWQERFGNPFFRYDVGGVRIISLNNANKTLSEDDYKFLEDSLKTGLRKIVVMHRPVGYLNPAYEVPLDDPEGRFRTLIENGGVTAVMTGHEHHYGHYEVNGIKYIVSGGGGGMLSRGVDNTFHHFLIVRAGRDTFDYTVERV